MRIDRIHIDAFGRLRNYDTGPEGLDGLVVVLGRNEAGKSTLFSFLTTALYGFQPASRERNPHVPWGTDEAGGRVVMRLDGDGCAEVERRLRSQPSGSFTREGRATDLRNQPLPWVEHVPRAVFRQVFAVTLGDLAALDGEAWARIQDKVVGSMGAADLRSPRSVAEALEREAGEIWRPSRRGNQRLRDLQSAIRALRERRAHARERDGRIRAMIEEREAVRTRLHEVRELRQRDRTRVDRVQSLVPLKRQLDRIDSLRAEGGDARSLSGLPTDPPARYAEMEGQRALLDARLRTLEAELAERESEVARFDDRARGLLARRDDIARLVAQAAACAPDRERARELQTEIRDVEARLDVTSGEVLDRSWRETSHDVIVGTPVGALRERVALRDAERSAPRPTAAPPATLTGVGLAGAAALLVWGLTGGPSWAAVVGAAMGGGLLVWLALGRPRRATEAPGSGAPPVGELLADLPIRRKHLARPGEDLVQLLEDLQTLARTRAQVAGALEAVGSRVAAVEAMTKKLAVQLGRPESDGADTVVAALDEDLRRAQRLEDIANVAARESRRLRLEKDAILSELAALRPTLLALHEVGATAGSGDVARGLENVRRRLGAHQRADQLEEELELEHPDLDSLRAQVLAASSSQSSWTIGDEELAAAKARIETYDEEIEELLARSEALSAEATHLRELETVDAVDGEAASLREEEARLVRERDRSWVLAQLLREADRRFREEHQPDLVRRAGSYLEHLTGGRYQRLVVDETGHGDLFHLVGPGLPAPVALAPPVSTGTLEQAYLSLRLAIVDHLDQGGERLPLFIDEVFVNWDRDRRERGLEVLAGVSKSRQVFVFTCHPEMAADLARRGGRVLRLGDADA